MPESAEAELRLDGLLATRNDARIETEQEAAKGGRDYDVEQRPVLSIFHARIIANKARVCVSVRESHIETSHEVI